MQGILQHSGLGLPTDKAADSGEEAVLDPAGAALGARDDAGNQATPKTHPYEYGQANAAKSSVVTGEPQEAHFILQADGEGPLEQSQPERRELTCIEEEMLDYSPTRSLPSLAAPSQGDLIRLSQSRKIEGLQGVPSALRGSIGGSTQALDKSLKWPEALPRDQDDALASS